MNLVTLKNKIGNYGEMNTDLILSYLSTTSLVFQKD
jgi:hypothetical protein